MADRIDPKDKLHGDFGAGSDKKVQQNYEVAAEDAKALIRGLRDLLGKSPSAKRLIQMGDEQGVTVKVLRGREESVYVPENKWIFMSTTPKTIATARLALMYAGGLREAEQNLLGHKRPTDTSDSDKWYAENLNKNLDIIIEMCRITKEISEQNQQDTDFLDSLGALGHDEFYKGFVNNSPREELIKLIVQKELGSSR